MSIFVVYLSHSEQGLYSYYDVYHVDSWVDMLSKEKACDELTDLFSKGWNPRAWELVYDRESIATGQSSIGVRVSDLLSDHGVFSFSPLWPNRSAEIKWKEGDTINPEIWCKQNRKSVDFSKITEDLCKGSTGNSYH